MEQINNNMIYITQQQKEEWEAKIISFYKDSRDCELINKNYSDVCTHKAFMLEDILSKAIVIPVEESWDMWWKKSADDWHGELKTKFPNGVIIGGAIIKHKS